MVQIACGYAHTVCRLFFFISVLYRFRTDLGEIYIWDQPLQEGIKEKILTKDDWEVEKIVDKKRSVSSSVFFSFSIREV